MSGGDEIDWDAELDNYDRGHRDVTKFDEEDVVLPLPPPPPTPPVVRPSPPPTGGIGMPPPSPRVSPASPATNAAGVAGGGFAGLSSPRASQGVPILGGAGAAGVPSSPSFFQRAVSTPGMGSGRSGPAYNVARESITAASPNAPGVGMYGAQPPSTPRSGGGPQINTAAPSTPVMATMPPTPGGSASPMWAPLASPTRNMSIMRGSGGSMNMTSVVWDNDQAYRDRQWIRFLEPKCGTSLYLNRHSFCVQPNRPKDYDGFGDEDEELEEMQHQMLRASSVHGQEDIAEEQDGHDEESSSTRVRNESRILSEAWEDQTKQPLLLRSPSTGTPVALMNGTNGVGHATGGHLPNGHSNGAQPQNGTPGANGHGEGGDANDWEHVHSHNTVRSNRLSVGANAAALNHHAANSLNTIESFLSSCTLFTKQMEALLTYAASPHTNAHDLSFFRSSNSSHGNEQDTIENKMKTIHDHLIELQQAIDARLSGTSSNMTINQIDSLLTLDKLQWDFSHQNAIVQRYRKTVLTLIDHQRYEYKMYHLPEHLSSYPLPNDIKNITILIKLPELISLQNGQEYLATTAATRISITPLDTCATAVSMAFKKCEGKLPDKSLTIHDFVLKGIGIADFMYSSQTKIMDHEPIRMLLRNGEEIKLSLIRKPSPTQDPEVCSTFVENYEKKLIPPPVSAHSNRHDSSVDDPNNGRSVSPMLYEDIRVHDSNEAFRDVTSRSMEYIPLSELTHLPFRLKIMSLDYLNEYSLPRWDLVQNIYIRVYIFYGCKNLVDTRDTSFSELSNSPRWYEWQVYKDLTLSMLPRGVRIAFAVFGRRTSKPEKEVLLAWNVHSLIDDQGFLTTGRLEIKLWSMAAYKRNKHGTKIQDQDISFLYRATTAQNLHDTDPPILTIQLDTFNLPVVCPYSEKIREPNQKLVSLELPLKSLTKDQTKQYDTITHSDLLREITSQEEIALLWSVRHHLTKQPSMLGKFLQSVNWTRIEDRMEAYRLLKIWAPPTSSINALELLDAKYPDPHVREYAINHLRTLKDDELQKYLLQLVQCLKFESYHDSPLKRFLIERSLSNPMGIGHYFFWHLKAELHTPSVCERFGVILEEYTTFAGRFTLELKKQAAAVLKLQRVAEMVVKLKRDHSYSDEEAMLDYHKDIEKLNKDFFAPMGKFQLPLDPKIEVTTLVVEKCRFMSSKMVPLWLVFRNADPDAPNVYVIFKSGDDLRQDILTLQLLTLMDSLWLSSGLDCRMKPYKCIATGINSHGEGVGMIEVVLNSQTTSGIQHEYGGGAMGALKNEPIDLYLHDNNKFNKDYERAVDNFVCSCAGYCVATYVLGIGDRHNGNIMVTKDGHLFHIDFGHFLGNFKTKYGFKRERSAFVFTPEMAFVMGGKNYKKSTYFNKFLEHSKRGFSVLRSNVNLLENLFVLMISADMPELQCTQDIEYMQRMLLLQDKETDAQTKLVDEIKSSLGSLYKRVDNALHIFKHEKSKAADH